MYTELPSTAQTAYAQLFEACQTGDYLRSVANLPGSFASKTVKGRTYWYFQYTEPAGKLRQVYVGPDTPEVKALIARKEVSLPLKRPLADWCVRPPFLGVSPCPQSISG
jgi:hypothetical protein